MDVRGRVVEAIKDGEIVRVHEYEAREQDLFILRGPPTENNFSKPEVKKHESVDKFGLRTPGTFRKEVKPAYRRNDVASDLIENFQWKIIRARRARGFGRKQFADAIGVSEEDMMELEYGNLPNDDFVLINKVQSFLRINLRKDQKEEEVSPRALLEKSSEVKKEEGEKKPVVRRDEKLGNILGNDIEIID